MSKVVHNLLTEMRVTTILILTLILTPASGQRLTGKYQDYFGHSLQLNNDSTFRFDWRFDLTHDWATVKWSSSDRLISFHFQNIYDTLSRIGKPDSLVLSLDETSNKIDEEEYATTML